MRSRGYQIIQSGRRSYRLFEHDSFIIQNNYWYWNSRGLKGYPVEFLTKIEGYTLPEAVHLLANGAFPKAEYSARREPLKLPEAYVNNLKVIDYLTETRGIDGAIIDDLIQARKLYESKQYHNCVFVGMDMHGEAKFASLRGTYQGFKQDAAGSDKSFPFFMIGTSLKALFFESPIDAMSHATLVKMYGGDWREHYRVSLGGVSDVAVEGFLKRHRMHTGKLIQEIGFCLDNDQAGQEARHMFYDKYTHIGFRVSIQKPMTKDWNEDLLHVLSLEEDSEGLCMMNRQTSVVAILLLKSLLQRSKSNKAHEP